MGFSPIQYFRKEDFPEIANEVWAQRLFTKLNGLSRQSQNNLDNNLTVTQNLSGFWWEGTVGAYTAAGGVVYPFLPSSPTAVVVKRATAINAFPFYIANEITPKRIRGVFVAQSYDVTDQNVHSLPAMPAGVAWLSEVVNGIDKLKIFAINGMVIGRTYFVRLLILSE